MKKITALLLCIVLLCSAFCYSAGAASDVTNIEVSGFTTDKFSAGQDYYLGYPKDFSACKITNVEATDGANISIKVEQYCGATKTVAVGDPLPLGYGRARVYVTVTVNNKTYTYLYTLADPNEQNYYYVYPTASGKVYSGLDSKNNPSGTVRNFTASTTNAASMYCVGQKGDYLQVVLTGSGYVGREGWVKKDQVSRGFTETAMPAVYTSKINALKKAHPNWTFEFVHMGASLQTYSQTVSKQTISNMADSKKTDLASIQYYMDPVNFLDEKNVFMFLDYSRYDPKTFSQKGVESIWVDKSNAVCTKEEAVDAFMEASDSLQLNPYFIAGRAAIESGYGTSALAKGTVKGYEGYYNFYGIGAVDSNPAQGGASYAKGRNWNSPVRAIIEGANWIKDQYVDRGQCTSYFLRFYPFRSTHIYMSDLAAPTSDAAKFYQGYSAGGTLNGKLHFIIPVYNDIKPYDDVPLGAWYASYVYTATEYNLFTGVEPGKFDPNANMTRAMLVTVLHRLEGKPSAKASAFKDVVQGSWYAKAVDWAAQNGIVTGVSKTEFDPDSPITREQIATILYRYAGYKNKRNNASGNLSAFADKNQISSFAQKAMAWAVGNKIINGKDSKHLDPKGLGSRAEVATIMVRYQDLIQ